MRSLGWLAVPLFLLFAFTGAPGLAQSAENPLPPLPSGRQLHFGYYFSDGMYGNYNDETRCYTNLYVPAAESPAELDQALQQATAAGQDVYFSLSLPTAGGSISYAQVAQLITPLLGLMEPYWDHVAYIELTDEPEWNEEETAVRYALVREVLEDLELPPRPLGVMLATSQVLYGLAEPPNAWTRSPLDWIGVQAYLHPSEGGQSTCDLVSSLRNRVGIMKRKLAPKPMILATQSYGFDGSWANIPGLAAMQHEYYRLAYDDPRVLALNAFAYARPWGTRHYASDLVPPHQQIGERVRHGLPAGCAQPAEPVPACGGGPGGSGPGDLQLRIVNLLANLTWTNGQGTPNQLRLFRKSSIDPDWLPSGSPDVGSTSAEVPLGQPGPGGREVCFKVVAYYGDGSPRESNVACETFYASAPSAKPHPHTPAGCAASLRPPLKWDGVPRATRHHVYAVHVADDGDVINDPGADGGSVYLPGLSFQPGHRYRWKVAACNNFGCGPWSDSVYFTPQCTARADADGNGASDLLLRHSGTGDHSLLFLSGSTQVGTATLDPPKPEAGNWAAVGMNDFNGDRKPDLVWRNADSGNIAFWFMAGAERTGSAWLEGPGASWQLVGTGDFNGDHHADLVFRLPGTQNLKAWFLDAEAQRIGAQDVSSAWGGFDLWEVAGVGDLNGDVWPDIVWRQPGTGSLALWHMSGTTNVVPGYLSPQALPDFNWRLASIADVDHNGTSDLVWQNDASAKLVVWLMEGLARVTGGFFTPEAPPDAALRAIGPR